MPPAATSALAEPTGAAAEREPPSAIFSRAAALHGAGRLAKAEAAYRQVLEAEPGHAGALRNLGLIALQDGQPARALLLLEQAVAAEPEDPQAWRSLGKLRQGRGEHDTALSCFRRALALRPEEAAPRRDLIEALLAAGRRAEAMPEIKAFLERHPVIADPRNSGQAQRIVALYGLERPDFQLGGGRPGVGFAFTINSGHFKIEDVIDHERQALTRVFLGLDSELGAIRDQLEADLVINCIADPELEPGTLAQAESLLEGLRLPVINDPARVRHTGRDRMSRLLGDLPGIVFPKTLRCMVEGPAALSAALETAGLGLPLILRPVESQTGVDMRRLETPEELAQAAEDLAGREVFAIAFHDFSDPGDGLWRKMRLFCIDGRLYPEHRLVLDHWNLHSADRLKLMREDRRLRLEEVGFLDDWRGTLGEAAAAALEQLHGRIKLDYFGIDFAVLPGGEVLIFEANPAMRINLDYFAHFPYQAGYIARITDAFKAMTAARLSGDRAA